MMPLFRIEWIRCDARYGGRGCKGHIAIVVSILKYMYFYQGRSSIRHDYRWIWK